VHTKKTLGNLFVKVMQPFGKDKPTSYMSNTYISRS